MSTGNSINSQKGFTLLEVIVALVLIASVGMGLYAWINSCIIGLTRVQEHELRREAILTVLAFIESTNPMEKPSGETTLGPYQVRWESNLVEPEKKSRGFFFGLYDTTVWIEIEGGGQAEFILRQVGYRRIQTNVLPGVGG